MRHSRAYTKENIEFLRKHAQIKGITNQELTDMYNEHFEIQRSVSSIAYIRSENGIALNSAKARASIGKNRRGSRPIGAERIRKGYVEIKVKQPNIWEQKHRHLWEQHHGKKLGKSEIVIFIDQNNRNFDIENLVMITRAEMGEMNQNQFFTEDKNINKAGINLVRLKQKTRKLKKENANAHHTN